MVKIIYAPPHRDAPFTHHSMPGFGPRLGQETRFTLWLMKQPQSRVILSAVGITIAICAIPQTFFPSKLPWTMSPEYQAANRAYMRYHNMNPIFGVSSKKPGLDH